MIREPTCYWRISSSNAVTRFGQGGNFYLAFRQIGNNLEFCICPVHTSLALIVEIALIVHPNHIYILITWIAAQESRRSGIGIIRSKGIQDVVDSFRVL